MFSKSNEFTLGNKYGKEAKDDLAELFTEYLKPFWYEENLVPGLTLYLHEHPDAERITTLVDTDEFRKDLLKACREHNVKVDDNFRWEVKSGLPQNSEVKEFRKGIYLLVGNAKVENATAASPAEPASEMPPVTAKITALKGDLVKKKYQLKAKPLAIYNIGRGENPQLAEGVFHKNQIAIVDDERKITSRQHACIVFDPQKGFCLKAQKGGASLLSGNSTLLFRNGKKVKEFSNTKDLEPLQDGDQIKLGVKTKESVVLLFEVEKPAIKKKK
jgi:pSer/pThr/pTyr-binding forkhead associated (FHA) protein